MGEREIETRGTCQWTLPGTPETRLRHKLGNFGLFLSRFTFTQIAKRQTKLPRKTKRRNMKIMGQ